MLSRETVLFARDDKEELIPSEVKLFIEESNPDYEEFKDETIVMVPLKRGELQKLVAKNKDDEADTDAEVIINHCLNPKLTKEDIPFLNPKLASLILDTILFESGLSIGKSRRKAVDDKETEFSKN